MRGRTNIVQRTGPVVIGDLEVQKQVTGEDVSIGDFVEFTGDTSQIEVVTNVRYTYSASFEINDDVIGYVLWQNSTVMSIVLFNKGALIKSQTFSNIGLTPIKNFTVGSDSNPSAKLMLNAYYYNGKLYVTRGFFDTIDGNLEEVLNYNLISIFNIGQSYEITYESSKNLSNLYSYIKNATFEGYDNSEEVAQKIICPFIFDGNIIVVTLGKYAYSNFTRQIIFFVLNFQMIVESYYIPIPSYDSDRYGSIFEYPSITINNEHIIFMYRTNKITVNGNVWSVTCGIAVFFLDKNSLQGSFIVNGDTHVNRYSVLQFYNNDAKVIKANENGLYFLLYDRIYRTGGDPNQYQYTSELCLTVCYFDMSKSSTIVTRVLKTITSTSIINFSRSIDMFLYEKDSKYYVIVLYNEPDKYDKYTSNFNFTLLVFNENTFFYESTSNVSVKLGQDETYQRTEILKYNDNVKVFVPHTNQIKKISLNVLKDVISQVESFDLVKKYDSRIDGVAKVGGSEGDLISVYVPS